MEHTILAVTDSFAIIIHGAITKVLEFISIMKIQWSQTQKIFGGCTVTILDIWCSGRVHV